MRRHQDIADYGGTGTYGDGQYGGMTNFGNCCAITYLCPSGPDRGGTVRALLVLPWLIHVWLIHVWRLRAVDRSSYPPHARRAGGPRAAAGGGGGGEA